MKTFTELKEMLLEFQQKVSGMNWSDDMFNFCALDWDNETHGLIITWVINNPDDKRRFKYIYPTDGEKISNDFSLWIKRDNSDVWVETERPDFKEQLS